MKRGIIRIVTGAVMILLQLVTVIGQTPVESVANPNPFYNIGYYSVGIVGVVLLIFGIRAYSNGFCSQLILHTNSKKIHTVTKWVGIVLSIFLFALHVWSFIIQDDFNIYTILMIFNTMSFAVYSLFYMYKKPSCLFSTTLILTGVTYLYSLISNITYYALYLPSMDNSVPYVILGIIPQLSSGILYIIIATKIYKENFSVKSVRTLGWITFALEFTSRILCNIVLQSFNTILGGLPNILYIVILLLFICVFEINTLRKPAVVEIGDTIMFCRKCGSQLASDSVYCNKCGTAIVKE